jgi:hypothetical protein
MGTRFAKLSQEQGPFDTVILKNVPSWLEGRRYCSSGRRYWNFY